MMKLFLSVMTLSLFVVGAINAQEDNSAMKPCENEVEKASADTSEVANKKVAKTICCFHPVPTFPGDLIKFFRSKLLWPGGSENKNIEGTVVVNFYIDSDGTCSEFKVVRSLNPDFNVEVLRVLMQMPKWIVNSKTKEGAWFTMPITFKK